jgi:hypothetical protein
MTVMANCDPQKDDGRACLAAALTACALGLSRVVLLSEAPAFA